MFCIDKVISKKLRNTRYNNPPWIRFKQTRELTDTCKLEKIEEYY